jgi:hypothetical protein
MSEQAGSTPPNKPTLTKKRFLVRFKDGGEAGPMLAAELQSLASAGSLGREDLVAVVGQKRWILAGEVVGLSFSDQACSTAIITPRAVADSVANKGKRDSGWFVGSAIAFAIAGLAAFGGWNESELERLRGNSVLPGIIMAALYSALPITVAIGMWLLGTFRNRLAESGSGAVHLCSIATQNPTDEQAQSKMSSHSQPSVSSASSNSKEDTALEHDRPRMFSILGGLAALVALGLGLWFASGLLVSDIDSISHFSSGDELTVSQPTRLFPTMHHAELYVRGDIRVQAEIAEQDRVGVPIWPKLRRGDRLTVETGASEDAEAIWVWMLRSGEVIKGFVPRNAVE